MGRTLAQLVEGKKIGTNLAAAIPVDAGQWITAGQSGSHLPGLATNGLKQGGSAAGVGGLRRRQLADFRFAEQMAAAS